MTRTEVRRRTSNSREQETSAAAGRVHGRLLPIVAAAISIVMGALIFYPLASMVWNLLFAGDESAWTVVTETFGKPGLYSALRATAILIVVVNLISVPLGTALAWLNERTDARMGLASTILPVVPMLLPPIALTIGWLFLGSAQAGFLSHFARTVVGTFGIELSERIVNIGTWHGLIFVYVLYTVPQVYVVTSAAFRSVDPSLEEAARVSGRGVWRIFFGISMPSIRHAVGSAVLLVTLSTIAIYSIPALIGSRAGIVTLSVYIVHLIHGSYPPLIAEAVTLALLVLVVVGVMWFWERRVAARGRHAAIGGRGVRAQRIRLGGLKHVARAGMCVYLALASVLPTLALFLVAFQPFWTSTVDVSNLTLENFTELFDTSGIMFRGMRNSLILAVVGSFVVASIAGLSTLYSATRGGIRERAMGILTKVPAAMPHLVIAVAMLVAFGGGPFFLIGTIWILLLAYVVMFLPNASIAAEAAYRQVGDELIEASRVCGAAEGETMRRILFPLMKPGLAAGIALIFSLMVGELTASVILAGSGNPVIGFVLLSIFENGTYAELAALGCVVALASGVTVVTTLALVRPRYTSGKAGRSRRAVSVDPPNSSS